MIQETLAKLEAAVEKADPRHRSELKRLLARLKKEISDLDRSDDGPLTAPLAELEATHPGLVSTVNEVSTFLAKIGI